MGALESLEGAALHGVTSGCDAGRADVMPPRDPRSHTATGSACGGGPYSHRRGDLRGSIAMGRGQPILASTSGPRSIPDVSLGDGAQSRGQRVTDEGLLTSTRASGRAKGELARTGDIRFRSVSALGAGVVIGAAAIATKALLNGMVDGDTGYIVLLAAAVLAAWYGGAIGGITATLVTVGLNAGIFVSPFDAASPATRVELVRLILYLLVGTGTALLVASRRASSDRLAEALGRRRHARGGDRSSRRPHRGHARGVRHRLLGMGRPDRWSDLVRCDLRAAWPHALRQRAIVRHLRRDDPPRRPRRIPAGHRGRARRRRRLQPRVSPRVAGRLDPLDLRRRAGLPRRRGAAGPHARHGPGHHPAAADRGRAGSTAGRRAPGGRVP